MDETQIKYMVDRFLGWKLPENFNPDGGISFERICNENTPWPRKNEPIGTNLLDATQAEEMVRYMIAEMPQVDFVEVNLRKEVHGMGEERVVKVCDTVVWHDAVGNPRPALVTAVWSQTCINVVFVSDDNNKQDNYGRQIERQTSCTHKSLSPVHGFYWRFEDEEPNPNVAPLES